MKIDNLYCKNNNLYKINKENQLIYYNNISYLKKNIRDIYSYIRWGQKQIYVGPFPSIETFQKIVTIYINRAYKLIKKKNEILNI